MKTNGHKAASAAPQPRNPLALRARDKPRNRRRTLQSILMRETFRQCTCGQRHTNIDLWEPTTIHRIHGVPQVARRYEPLHSTYIPNLDIEHTIDHKPLAVCPSCIDTRRQQAAAALIETTFPPIEPD